MKSMTTAMLIGVLALGGALVSGCREEEQGRLTRFEKGKYLGAPYTQIGEDTRTALKKRVEAQRF